MLKNEVESYVRIGEDVFEKNLTYPYMGVGGVKNCQNHPIVINEWPLRQHQCCIGSSVGWMDGWKTDRLRLNMDSCLVNISAVLSL